MKGKIIKDYPTYSVDQDGNVYSNGLINRARKLKPQSATQTKRYLQVRLFNDTNPKGKLYYIHRLVYEAYHGNISDNMTIDHIDGNSTNNHYNNLQQLTLNENASKG